MIEAATVLAGSAEPLPVSPASPGTRMSLSGVEAIVRLLVLRHQLDLEQGLQVATMISGYPGSPLGGVDLMLEQQKQLLDAHRVLHQPGVNEELALAAAWGSQMGASVKYEGVDGVVAGWYGKTPGLDRSGDVLRHASALGSGPNGGFVVFCGDDPSAKSSTLPCDSQYAFQDLCVPVLYPGDQQEVLELGVHAFALSRWAGPVVGLKIVTSVADGTGTVDLDVGRYRSTRELSLPIIDGKPWKHQPLWTIGPHRIPEQERLMVDNRLTAAKAYVRQHGLDRVYGSQAGARLGIVCAGKTYYDVMQAFSDLGITRDALAAVGVSVLKLAMTFPIVEETVVEFARSVEQLVVIEEKRPFIETQLRAAVNEAGCSTRVLGKRTREGKTLISSVGELDAAQISQALTTLLPELEARRRLDPKLTRKPITLQLQLPARPPAYCSGCPHNRSTVAPKDALIGGGIGCHGMVYFEPRQNELQKLPPPPMGAEGVPWIGLAPFVRDKHLIQNIGDGTLSHSGTLAIRASVAAGVNVTYKILYNGVVAMTGGQDIAGLLDVPALTRELEAEGVSKIVVCADHPRHYPHTAKWASDIEVLHRDALEETQQKLRQVKGVSVIIYDQRCAAEARSLRKQGLLATPPARVVINEAVCEGCGDCVRKSNCMSVLPHHTEFGDKRRIDDLTCNRDYTCMEGDCPSFVTLVPKGAQEKKPVRAAVALPKGQLPLPPRAALQGSFGVYFTGIGGTGVVTAGRILTAAAEAAGLVVSAMDQTGLSQKAGAVVSHLHFAATREALGSASVGPMGADVYLSGDILQAAGPAHLAKVRPGQTIAAIEREIAPTSAMQQAAQRPPELSAMQQVVTEQLGEERVRFVESTRIAEKVFSESVLANVVLLGAAFQLGGFPFSLAHVEQALERNSKGKGKSGRGSNANREAFEWGRWAAHDPQAVEAALAAVGGEHPTLTAFEPSAHARSEASALLAKQVLPAELAAHVQRRVAQVIDYQNTALARRFLSLVLLALVRDTAERSWQLTRALLESWFKLLTYKDEYEVARLHAAASYDRVAKQLGIEGRYKLEYHLHPPILQRFGLRKKLPFGKLYELLFAVLRRMKWVRGTLLDIFRWDPDRKLERQLIEEYQTLAKALLADTALPYDTQVEIAASALEIRGYSQVKERNVELWRERVAKLRGPLAG